MSLRDKAISGVKWAGTAQVLRNVLAVITTAILARLLSPSDFGLMGMAVVVVAFMNLFGDLGISAAIVHRRELSANLLSSAFWANVGFGFLLTALVAFGAPLVAAFYLEPRLAPLLAALSAILLFTSLGVVQRALLERTLRFSTIAVVETSATGLGSAVGIGAAVLGAGVWSLALQALTLAAANTLLLWRFSPWKPGWKFAWAELRSVTGYSLNLTGFGVVNYFSRNADKLLIGRYLGAQDLGYYVLAYQLMLYPLQQISRVVGRVMFPVFSRMQDDDTRFQNAYLKTTTTIAMVTLPMMCGLWVLAEPLVLAVFGPSWKPVAVLLMILAPVGAIQSLGTLVGDIYQAKGRTDLQFRWGLFSSFIIVSSFVIGLRWGIVGVAAAYAVATIILTYPGLRLAYGLINMSVRRMIVALARPAAAALVMLGALLVVRSLLPPTLSDPWVLATLAPAGMLSYALLIYYLDPARVRELLAIIGAKQ